MSIQHYQSIFGNAATEVRQFNTLFVIFLVVCAVMYVAVIAFLIAGIARRRRAAEANTVEELQKWVTRTQHRQGPGSLPPPSRN